MSCINFSIIVAKAFLFHIASRVIEPCTSSSASIHGSRYSSAYGFRALLSFIAILRSIDKEIMSA